MNEREEKKKGKGNGLGKGKGTSNESKIRVSGKCALESDVRSGATHQTDEMVVFGG